MTDIQGLEAANNNGFLWPPIADAVDTYLRRRHEGAQPYERAWRLIHVWESTEITLALAAMARLGELEPGSPMLRRQREFFHGKHWEPVTQSFRSVPGASAGTIDQWINILDEIAKANELQGEFLQALCDFLKTEEVDVTGLTAAWSKACEVPLDFQDKGNMQVRTAMRVVNSFRNRFAHVPFPHDALDGLAEALEVATDRLFGLAPLPLSHAKDGKSSPLTGAFKRGESFLQGNLVRSVLRQSDEDIVLFVFPCQRDYHEAWSARALIHVDGMMRPHVLTRVKETGECEYTRFRAESNAVLDLPEVGLPDVLGDLTKDEYITEKEVDALEEGPDRPTITMGEALEAIRSGEYDLAIDYFQSRATTTPSYHIAWLRLGHARREKAVRIFQDDPAQAADLLIKATGDLAKAAGHVDPEYKATSHYELSKVWHHLAKVRGETDNDRERSLAEAKMACEFSADSRFQTWLEYVRRFVGQSVGDTSAGGFVEESKVGSKPHLGGRGS